MQNSTVCLISAANVTLDSVSTGCSICANSLPSDCVAHVMLELCRLSGVMCWQHGVLAWCCHSAGIEYQQILSPECEQNLRLVEFSLLTRFDRICRQPADTVLTFCLLGI